MSVCRYCGSGPLRNSNWTRCSQDECRRAAKRDYMRQYQRAYAARTGAWANSRYRSRGSNRSCIDCGAPVRHGRSQETRCRSCHHPTVSRREKAAAKLERAARGTRGKTAFVGGDCWRCGATFVGRRAGSHCTRSCREKDKRAARRAREAGVKVTPGRRYAVFVRDGWLCQICGDPVNAAAQVPELDAPVVDHVVPLAVGGVHGPENWQTAHFYCNSVKSDQVGFEFAEEAA